MKRRLPTLALAVLLLGCSSPDASASQSQSQAAESSAPSAASVVCEFFAEGGPNDELTTAASAAFTPGAAADEATRAAIAKIEEIAGRASGEEQEDLLTFAGVIDAAKDWAGWWDASNAFRVKYADQCGYQLAE